MLKYVLDIVDLLDDPQANGKTVVEYLDSVAGAEGSSAEVTTVAGERGSTDFVMVRIPGSRGRTARRHRPHPRCGRASSAASAPGPR